MVQAAIDLSIERPEIMVYRRDRGAKPARITATAASAVASGCRQGGPAK